MEMAQQIRALVALAKDKTTMEFQLGMVVHTYRPSMKEANTERIPQVIPTWAMQ